MQLRPCFLIVDTEHAGSISTRKLVLETARYNVITAFSCGEAHAELQRFPNVDGVVLNGAMRDLDLPALHHALCERPEVKLIVVGHPLQTGAAREADVLVESFAPPQLLAALDALFPRQSAQIHRREDELAEADF